MAAEEFGRAFGSGQGPFWRRSGAVASILLGLFAAGAAQADERCPKAAVPVFQANDGWTELSADAAKELTILAIGSSSTAGIGASSATATYPAQLQAFLSAGLEGIGVTIENAGISGEVADATEARLEKLVGTGAYDVVIWQVGTNDALGGVDQDAFRRRLERGIAAVKRAAAKLILVNQQFFPGISDPARYEAFAQTVSDVGAKSGVAVFSRYALMKAWADGSPALLAAMLYDDRFHMSDRGYACLALALSENIRTVIPGRAVATGEPPAAAATIVKAEAVPGDRRASGGPIASAGP